MLARAFTTEPCLQALSPQPVSFRTHPSRQRTHAGKERSSFKEERCLSTGLFGYETVPTLELASILREGKGWSPDASQDSSMYDSKVFTLAFTTCKTSLQDNIEPRQK